MDFFQVVDNAEQFPLHIDFLLTKNCPVSSRNGYEGVLMKVGILEHLVAVCGEASKVVPAV